MFEIKQYSYDNVNLKTVNTQITGFTSENASTATVRRLAFIRFGITPTLIKLFSKQPSTHYLSTEH